jgi:enoyl-CoA hydratase/carnithine racemase
MKNIELSVEGDVARLTFQRPEKRNAFTAEMWDGIVSCLAELERTESVRALAVTGAGGSFSAGADLESVKRADGSRSPAYQETALRGLAAIQHFPRPTLALIDGPCIGGGCSLALACDVRFASATSIFSVPAVRHGFSYDEWSLRRLVELVGSGQASRFLFSAMRISGRDAADIGLVELCSDDLQAEADAYLSAVASGDIATISATRESLRRFAGLHDGGNGRPHD